MARIGNEQGIRQFTQRFRALQQAEIVLKIVQQLDQSWLIAKEAAGILNDKNASYLRVFCQQAADHLVAAWPFDFQRQKIEVENQESLLRQTEHTINRAVDIAPVRK